MCDAKRPRILRNALFAAAALSLGHVGPVEGVVVATPPVIWTGDVNSDWDLTTHNWHVSAVARSFAHNDDVLFDGTASIKTVNLNGSFMTGNVTIDTTSAAYTFGGSGTISVGGSLALQGTNAVSFGSNTIWDVANITALDSLTFQGGGKLTSSTGEVHFSVAQDKTVTWNNNTFVNSANTKLVKEGAGTLSISNFNSGDQSKDMEVLGGTLRAITNGTTGVARNYLIKGSSETDIATFVVALAANNKAGFFSKIEGNETGGAGATMVMEYGKLLFESGTSHGMPKTLTMRSSTIQFDTGLAIEGTNTNYQIASLPTTLTVERPTGMTEGVGVSHITATHSQANQYGLHLRNNNGTTQFDVKKNAKLVVDAILSSQVGSPNGNTAPLTKKGEGELELRRANLFTGATQVQAGTLRLASGSSIKSTSIEVSNGGRLILSGSGQIVSNATVTVATGGTIGGVGTLATNLTLGTDKTLEIGTEGVGGELILSGSSVNLTDATLLFNFGSAPVVQGFGALAASAAPGDATLTVTGTLAGADDVNITFNGIPDPGNKLFIDGVSDGALATWKLNGVTLTSDQVSALFTGAGLEVTPIPEPSTYALFGGVGALALALLRRRKRKS
jgi:autotransporter-associated beta strand protein